MKRNTLRTTLTVLVALGASPVARVKILDGQVPLGSERQDIRNTAGDIWAVWTSPARATAEDIAPTLGAVALIGGTGLADSVVWAWMTSHQHTAVMRGLTPIREDWKLPLFEFGSGQVLLPMSGILYVSGRLSHSAGLRDAGLGCAAGHLASLGVRSVVYETVSRARPRVTDDPYEISIPGAKSWDWHSFLSGHIANSMACASFVGHRFSLGKATPLPYLASAAIGLGRMADGRHWFSDTMTGAVLGFAIGKALAARTLRRESALRQVASPSTSSIAATMASRSVAIPVFRLSFDF